MVWTATFAAFMATQPSGGTDLHPERGHGPRKWEPVSGQDHAGKAHRAEAQRRMATSRRFCFAMESGLKVAPENRWQQPLPIRPG
ncbi:hypothetical protein [Ancylobacter mangrovi]|uniref:hypothetical protein n=1 Tax=Ancylobacter mangrovi TaxID=2972472 RepID=UPI002161D00A|nr:hypothetical protein [Ancylobacter mangrovi]MCS0504786.1 hypothetical protein [Ancylobacter mangrovi]